MTSRRDIGRLRFERRRPPKDLDRSGAHVEPDRLGRLVGRDHAERGDLAVDRDRADLGVGKIEDFRCAVGRDSVQPIPSIAPADRKQPAIGQEVVFGIAEDPVGRREFDRHRRDRLDPPIHESMQVHPAVGLGDEMEDAVGRPARLGDPVGPAARDDLRGANRPVVGNGRELELRAVPWHVRVPPLEPGEGSTVRRQPRSRVEVRARRDDLDLARGGIDRDEIIDPLAMRTDHGGFVILSHRVDPAPRDVRGHVGEPPRTVGRQGNDLAGRHHPVEAPGREVRRNHEIARHQGRRAAVFVDPAARVESLGCHPRDGPVRFATDERLATALLGPAFQPPPDAGMTPHLADEHHAIGQTLDRKRRRPAPVRRDDSIRHRYGQVPWRHDAT